MKSEVVLQDDAVDLINIAEEKPEYTYQIKTNSITAPFKRGDKVGEVDIFFNGEKKMTLDLTVKKDVNKCSLFTLLKRMMSLIILGSK